MPKEKPQVRITIEGERRTGRTTLLNGIYQYLKRCGVDVVISTASDSHNDGDTFASNDLSRVQGVTVVLSDRLPSRGSIIM